MAVRGDLSGVDRVGNPWDQEVLATPIQELQLSVRALRVLNELDIETIGDLVKLTPNALSGRRNCGRKTIAELLDLMERFYPILDKAAVPERAGRVVDEFHRFPSERLLPLLRRVSEFRLPTRALNTLDTLGITYIGDLVQLTPSNLLRNHNFGKKSLKEIECMLGTMGLSLGMTHLGWDPDLAARLEKKFERELNGIRLREIGQRASPHGGEEVTPGWRIKFRSGQGLSLETTFVQLLRSQTSRRNAEMLRRLYGWDGLGPRTLESVGQEYGLTRERVRQIAARFEKRVGSWINLSGLDIVNRALSHLNSRCPCRADLAERELCDLNISEKPFRIDGLLLTFRLAGKKPPLEIALIEGERFVGPSGTAEIGKKVLQVARYLVEHWGCTTLDEVSEHSSSKREFVQQLLEATRDFEWLDPYRGWFWLKERPRNRLLNNIQKIVSVANPIDIRELRGAVGRHHRMAGFAPPSEVLLHLCERAAGYGVAGRKVNAWPPIEPASVLSENEMTLFRVLKHLGSVASKDELEANCMKAGMNRNSFNIYLSYSPIIARYGKGVYGLIGSEEVSASAVEALHAPKRAKRVLLDHGWTPDGRVWVAYRLSRASLGSGLFHIPSAIAEFVEGSFKLQGKDGTAIGVLNVRGGNLSGLEKIFARRGGEVGDILVVSFNATTAEASMELDGFELLERYASGSEDLLQDISPIASDQLME